MEDKHLTVVTVAASGVTALAQPHSGAGPGRGGSRGVGDATVLPGVTKASAGTTTLPAQKMILHF